MTLLHLWLLGRRYTACCISVESSKVLFDLLKSASSMRELIFDLCIHLGVGLLEADGLENRVPSKVSFPSRRVNYTSLSSPLENLDLRSLTLKISELFSSKRGVNIHYVRFHKNNVKSTIIRNLNEKLQEYNINIKIGSSVQMELTGALPCFFGLGFIKTYQFRPCSRPRRYFDFSKFVVYGVK